MSEKLIGALPAGSLQNPCLDLWRSAGYRLQLEERSLFPTVDDPEIELVLLRPQEIPRYVAEGKLDFGICGYDCMVECDCEELVTQMAELIFSKVSRKPTKWVLAVRANSPVQSVGDLQGKNVDAEFVTMTRNWLAKQGVEATVHFSWGCTEVKPGRFCDAIVEATETGSSLKCNGLRIVAEVLSSTPRFITNPAAFADPWKREKMEDIVLMLKGVLDAEGKSWLALNVANADLPEVLKVLPSLHAPTINNLADREWSAVNTIVDETVVRVIIPKLRRAGARDIVVSPITKMIL